MSKVVSQAHSGTSRVDKSVLPRPLSLVLFLVVAIAFTVLAVAAHNTPYFEFDLAITRAVQSMQNPVVIALLNLIGLPGYPPQVYIEIVAVLVLLWVVGARSQAIGFLFANVAVGTLGMGVKLLVARMRPSPELVQVANPGLDGGGLSFPAGHVLVYVTVLGFLMVLLWRVPHRRWWQTALFVVLAVMIVLIGPARIYSGEHWFSDVVGGYLFGVMGLWLTLVFYDWVQDRFFRNNPRDASSETILTTQ